MAVYELQTVDLYFFQRITITMQNDQSMTQHRTALFTGCGSKGLIYFLTAALVISGALMALNHRFVFIMIANVIVTAFLYIRCLT